MSWECAASKGLSSVSSVVQRAPELFGFCLASDASVCCWWFPSERNPADEPSRRFEWSPQYHGLFRVTSNSRLPRRCFFLDELDPSSADSHAVQRVETENNCCVFLAPAAAEAAEEQDRAANRAVKASALPLGFALDERWRSTPSLTTSEPRLSQPVGASMLGCSPGLHPWD